MNPILAQSPTHMLLVVYALAALVLLLAVEWLEPNWRYDRESQTLVVLQIVIVVLTCALAARIP